MDKQATTRVELFQITQLEISTDPGDDTIIIGKGFDGNRIEVCLTSSALIKLETFLAQANIEQAKRQPSH
jgi:hypothetical protein